MLRVYTEEDRGLSPCVGGKEDRDNVMVIAFYQTSVS